MIKIKFSNERKFHEVEFTRISSHVIQVIGNISGNTSGFMTYKMNGIELGDFTKYNTIYNTVNGGFQFSDDGSVYPDKPKPEEAITFEKIYNELKDIQNQTTNTQIALCDTYEQCSSTEKQLTDLQLAVCDIYEMLLGGV